MTVPYFHSSGVVTNIPALHEPPSEVPYIVAISKRDGNVIAVKMAARLHGKPEPRIISLGSSPDDDILTILSDGHPRTTDCIYHELHTAYAKLPHPWGWLFKWIPLRWQISDRLYSLWNGKKIASYGQGNGGGWSSLEGLHGGRIRP